MSKSFGKLPGLLHLNPSVIIKNTPAPLPSVPQSINVSKLFDKSVCQNFVPDQVLRSMPHMKRKQLLEDSLRMGRRVKFVDGSMVDLPSDRGRLRPRQQLKALEKKATQITIRVARTKERIYGQILSIISESVQNPLIQLPIWRITRVQQSRDYQFCTIRWTIDDSTDYEKYHGSLSQALSKATSVIRYQLASRMSLKVAPLIQFEYEDWTVDAVHWEESQSSQ